MGRVALFEVPARNDVIPFLVRRPITRLLGWRERGRRRPQRNDKHSGTHLQR